MYACMYVCVYVCMYIYTCMYVCIIYIYIYIYVCMDMSVDGRCILLRHVQEVSEIEFCGRKCVYMHAHMCKKLVQVEVCH